MLLSLCDDSFNPTSWPHRQDLWEHFCSSWCQHYPWNGHWRCGKPLYCAHTYRRNHWSWRHNCYVRLQPWLHPNSMLDHGEIQKITFSMKIVKGKSEYLLIFLQDWINASRKWYTCNTRILNIKWMFTWHGHSFLAFLKVFYLLHHMLALG